MEARPCKASETGLPKLKAAEVLPFFFESFVSDIYEYLKVLVRESVCLPDKKKPGHSLKF